MCPTMHQQSAPSGAQSFPSRALTTVVHFYHSVTPGPLSTPLHPYDWWSIGQASGERWVRERQVSESCLCLLLWVPGAIVPQVCQLPSLQLGSTAQVSLLMTSCGLLGTWHQEHLSVRAGSLFHLTVQSLGLTGRWCWVRLRNTPSHPVHGGWLPCATGFNIAHQTTSKLPSWCAHCSAKSSRIGHQQCKLLAGFPSPHFPLQLQGGALRHKKSKLQGRLSPPGHGRTGSWRPLPFPVGSLMAAMNQQPVDLWKGFPPL